MPVPVLIRNNFPVYGSSSTQKAGICEVVVTLVEWVHLFMAEDCAWQDSHMRHPRLSQLV